jgi:prephenate dehydratase
MNPKGQAGKHTHTSKKITAAFQGEYGAYSEEAILKHYGLETVTLPCESFDRVFAAVEGAECDLGFIPVENSLAGSIHRNYDLLLQHSLSVVGEHSLRISHCLIGLPGASVEGIHRVISHPQALAQCEQSLRALPGVRVEAVYDTAGSVKMVKELGDLAVAAVASLRAAEIYGLPVLRAGMEDNPANFTRFQIIAREPAVPGLDAKTSIVFALNNRAGELYRAMSVFALREIDLTKIESRPMPGVPWDYYYYIDLIGSTAEPVVQRALANLEEYATFFRVLGSYPRYRA